MSEKISSIKVTAVNNPLWTTYVSIKLDAKCFKNKKIRKIFKICKYKLITDSEPVIKEHLYHVNLKKFQKPCMQGGHIGFSVQFFHS